MPGRLTSKIALDMVLRIEALNEQIADVYREANGFDGLNNSSVIFDAVEAREAVRGRADDAAALIGSFDFDDEGNRIGPEDEPAWPAVSAKLREMFAGNSKALKMVETIDKLTDLAAAHGLRQVSMAELDAALAEQEE